MDIFTLLAVADPAWTEPLRKTLFARDGMRIVVAAGLAEAEQKARFAPPDLVISKHYLSDGTADDLCRRLKRNTDLKGCRVVVMVDAEKSSTTNLLLMAGADQVIVEPKTPEALTALMAQLLNAPLRQEIRIPVEVRVEGEVGAGTLQGLTRNLSLGGSMIEVAKSEVNKGDFIFVRLHLQGVGQPVVSKAEVVRVAELPLALQLGVRFVKFDKDGRERLEAFLGTVS